MRNEKLRSALRHVRNVVGAAATVAVITAVAALVAGVAFIPAVTGWVKLTVLTSSMEPGLPAGTLIVVEQLDDESRSDLKPGDVITFQPDIAVPSVTTHRIVNIQHRGDGTRAFITRGDANGAPDEIAVPAAQVLGALRYQIPYIGWVTKVSTGDQRAVGAVIAAVGLVVYAGVQAVLAVRAPRRRSAAYRVPIDR